MNVNEKTTNTDKINDEFIEMNKRISKLEDVQDFDNFAKSVSSLTNLT